VSGRRALLIGVPEYKKEEIEDIPVIRQDLALMEGALERLDFDTEVVGLDPAEPPVRLDLEERLEDLLEEAETGETVLIYFTGHGSLGRDYSTRLWPQDARPSTPKMRERSLLPIDLRQQAAESQAGLVILFVDACRVREEDSAGLKAFYARAEPVRRHQLLIVYGCGYDQVCQYVTAERSPTGEGFSLFTQALVEALADGPGAISDLLDTTQERLDELVKSLNASLDDGSAPFAKQTLHREVNATQGSPLWNLSLTGEPIEDEQDPWFSLATQAGLWGLSEERDRDRWVTWAGQVAEWCSDIVQASADDRTGDPWGHPDHPAGLLEKLEERVDQCKGLELTPPEAALLVVAPLVREAVIAQGLSGLVSADVHDMVVRQDPSESRGQLQRTHHRFADLASHGVHLQGLGRQPQAAAIAWWLAYRCLLRDPSFWMAPPDGMAGSFPDPPQELHDDLLALDLVWRLACAIHGDPSKLLGPTDTCGVPARWDVGRGSGRKQLRPRMLGILLSLGGRLSLDLRHAPEVLVSHIGLSDPLDVDHVTGRIQKARWIRTGGTHEHSGRSLALRLRCRHPAVDHALRLMVQAADDVLREIQGIIRDVSGLEPLAKGLPERLTADELLPESVDGVPAYQTPHVRFELGHKEVRQLLMGERLYGEPELAVRELYQNALDALRYREAREAWLNRPESTAKFAPLPPPSIRFFQSEEDGRPYLLCVDNGVGMDLETVRECFAQAGKRFCEMPSYLEESWRWKQAGLAELHPNSRFGVGVFSYFMLADEIEVETCRFLESGERGPVLSAKISSAGALFRISEKKDRAWLEDTGTAVRLWLKPRANATDEELFAPEHVDGVAALQRLLLVAEYPTSAKGRGGQVDWEPGTLTIPPDGPLEIVNGDGPGHCATADPRVWWVSDGGGILSDGLATQSSLPQVVVNLTQGDERELSVDRKSVLSYDRREVNRRLIGAAEGLLDWQGLTFEWLWELSEKSPLVATQLVAVLVELHPGLSPKVSAEDPRTFRLADVGVFHLDRDLLHDPRQHPSDEFREQVFPLAYMNGLGDEDLTPVLLQRLATWAVVDPSLLKNPSIRRLPLNQVPAGRLGPIQTLLLGTGADSIARLGAPGSEELVRVSVLLPSLLGVDPSAVVTALEDLRWTRTLVIDAVRAALHAGLHGDTDLVALLYRERKPPSRSAVRRHRANDLRLYPDLLVAYARRTGLTLASAAQRLLPLAVSDTDRADLNAAPDDHADTVMRALLSITRLTGSPQPHLLILAQRFNLSIGELARAAEQIGTAWLSKACSTFPADLAEYTPDQADLELIFVATESGRPPRTSRRWDLDTGLRRMGRDGPRVGHRIERLGRLGIQFEVPMLTPVLQSLAACRPVRSFLHNEPWVGSILSKDKLDRLGSIITDDLDLRLFAVEHFEHRARSRISDASLPLSIRRFLDVVTEQGWDRQTAGHRLDRCLTLCNGVTADSQHILELSYVLGLPVQGVARRLASAAATRFRPTIDLWAACEAKRPVRDSDLRLLRDEAGGWHPVHGRALNGDWHFLTCLASGGDPLKELEAFTALLEVGVHLRLSIAALHCLQGSGGDFLSAYLGSAATKSALHEDDLKALQGQAFEAGDLSLLWWPGRPTGKLDTLSLLRSAVLLGIPYDEARARADGLTALKVEVDGSIPGAAAQVALAAELERPLSEVFERLPPRLHSVLIPNEQWLATKRIPSHCDAVIAGLNGGLWTQHSLEPLALLAKARPGGAHETGEMDGWSQSLSWLPDLGFTATIRPLKPSEFIKHSARGRESLQQIGDLIPAAFWPAHLKPAQLTDHVADHLDLTLISQDVDGLSPFWEGGIPMSHVVRVASVTGKAVPELIARARALAPLGFGIRDSPGGLADSWTDDSEGPEQPDARPSVEPELDA